MKSNEKMNDSMQSLPQSMRATIEHAWAQMSPQERAELKRMLPYLSRDLPGVKDVITRVLEHYRVLIIAQIQLQMLIDSSYCTD